MKTVTQSLNNLIHDAFYKRRLSRLLHTPLDGVFLPCTVSELLSERAMTRKGNEVIQIKKSIIPPAHPQGLTLFKASPWKPTSMLILQIFLLQPNSGMYFSTPGLDFEECSFTLGPELVMLYGKSRQIAPNREKKKRKERFSLISSVRVRWFSWGVANHFSIKSQNKTNINYKEPHNLWISAHQQWSTDL